MISWGQYMDIFALRRQGLSLRKISEQLGIHRGTVTKYLNQGHAPKYKKIKRKDFILTPYLQLIDEWLAQDNYRASWIYYQIKNLGYEGGYGTVKNHVRRVKKRYQILQYRKEQRQRLYGRIKAKATRGLVNGSLFPQVLYRPLSVYDQFAQGGGPWTN